MRSTTTLPTSTSTLRDKLISLSGLTFSKSELRECPSLCKIKFRKASGKSVRGVFTKRNHLRLLSQRFDTVNLKGYLNRDGTFTVESIDPVLSRRSNPPKQSLAERKKRLEEAYKIIPKNSAAPVDDFSDDANEGDLVDDDYEGDLVDDAYEDDFERDDASDDYQGEAGDSYLDF